MNKAYLIGRLAADPELKQTGNGVLVVSFTIAVDRTHSKDSDHQTDWIDIVAWRNTAEFICKYFHKGSPIVIDGSIQTRDWEDKGGNKRKSVEIRADNVEFVPRSEILSGREPKQSHGAQEDFSLVDDEDCPF